MKPLGVLQLLTVSLSPLPLKNNENLRFQKNFLTQMSSKIGDITKSYQHPHSKIMVDNIAIQMSTKDIL